MALDHSKGKGSLTSIGAEASGLELGVIYFLSVSSMTPNQKETY
jgi:hypothetical protein